jgi:hypothetical protein
MKSQKELKQAYKLEKQPMGVFQTKHKETGKAFIGHSMDVSKAANSQFFQLRINSHRNESLQHDWNKYGADAFEYIILEELKEPEDEFYFDPRKALKMMEDFYIKTLENTYNLA